MDERTYPIHCACGAVVPLSGWYLHMKYKDPSRPHEAPWERIVVVEQQEGQ